jgi:hypothetical protein
MMSVSHPGETTLNWVICEVDDHLTSPTVLSLDSSWSVRTGLFCVCVCVCVCACAFVCVCICMYIC